MKSKKTYVYNVGDLVYEKTTNELYKIDGISIKRFSFRVYKVNPTPRLLNSEYIKYDKMSDRFYTRRYTALKELLAS